MPLEYHSTTTWMPLNYQLSATLLPLNCHLNTTWRPLECHSTTTWIPLNYHLMTTWLPLDYHLTTTWLSLDCHLTATGHCIYEVPEQLESSGTGLVEWYRVICCIILTEWQYSGSQVALKNNKWHSSGRVANNWLSGCPLVKLTQIWFQWQWIGLSGIQVVQWHSIGYHLTFSIFVSWLH